MKNLLRVLIVFIMGVAVVSCTNSQPESGVADSTPQKMKMTTEIPEGISTPNVLNSEKLGELKFFDGVPYPETIEKVYDYVDLHNAVDVIL